MHRIVTLASLGMIACGGAERAPGASGGAGREVPVAVAAAPAFVAEAFVATDAVAVGFGEGARWYAARTGHVAVFDGAHEVERLDVRVPWRSAIVPLAGRRGARIRGEVLSPSGEVRFSSDALARAKGRWGHVVDAAASPDGQVVIVAWNDPPSTCLCDQGKPWANGSRGLDLVDRRGEGRPHARRLADREARAVAASATHVAAASPGELRVWAHAGGEPVTVRDHATPTALAWSGDGRALIVVAHDEVIVRDAGAGLAERGRWTIPGMPMMVAARPGRDEVAVAHVPDGASVERGAVTLRGLDGEVRAELAIAGRPLAIGWDAAGERLLVASSAGWVARYRVR